MKNIEDYRVYDSRLDGKTVKVTTYGKVYDLYYRSYPELLRDRKFKVEYDHSDVAKKSGKVVGLYSHSRSATPVTLALVEMKNKKQELFRVFVDTAALEVL